SRKMTEDIEDQLCAMRAHNTALTEQMLSNTMEFGQKLARAKEPQELAQCQSEVVAKQAQAVADQTKGVGQEVQHGAQEVDDTASSAMEVGRRAAENGQGAIAAAVSRVDRETKRQRAEA